MKLKQITTSMFALVVFLTMALVSLGPISSSVSAYKCVGNPDDFYFEEPGSAGENKTKIPTGTTGDQINFRWDQSMGRCVVTMGDGNSSYKSQYDDGSPRECNDPTTEKQQKVNGEWRCIPQKTYGTNDKPVNDDGSPLDASQHYCGGEQDNYDVESFSCKESGSCNYNPLDSCNYNKVGLVPDPTSNCVTSGGIYNKSNTPSCAFTADSCKKAGKKLDSKTNQCAELDTCDKQFGGAGQKAQYDACEKALNGADTECSQANPVLKAACQVGKSVSVAEDNFDTCGKAQTVLISCDEKDCGVGNGQFEGVPVIGCVLKYGIQILTVLVGIAAVGGIAWEAMQYARAQDDQSTVSNARKRIRDIVIGLFVYGFMIAIINWLIPGSVIQ